MEINKKNIEAVFNKEIELQENEIKELQSSIIKQLNEGIIRSAEKLENGDWQANEWVKKAILLLFRYSKMTDYSINSSFQFYDKDTLPLRPVEYNSKLRIVPGGSAIRTGCYVADGVICMPPMYINIGAYVDEGTMIDSHALVGTCAQIGKRVHLSAASQIGGVLEPANARPVIVEDDVMIGGNCGVYEGVLVRERAVLGSGVILTGSTKVFDLVNNRVLSATPDNPLEIPAEAVVVPGSRKIKGEFAEEYGLSIQSPLIIKYRDSKTDAKTALEFELR